MIGITSLTDAIRTKYLNGSGFTVCPATETNEGLLVAGSMHRKQVSWADRVSEIAGVKVEVGNTTAAGVLLIRAASDQAWALTYGMGFQLLEPTHVDPRFGMRVAIRTAAPDAIKSLTKSELDCRSRTDRSSIPGGEALRSFGVGNFGEVITRIGGSAVIPGLTVGDSAVQIRAADSLSVPLGKKPYLLVRNLNAIGATLGRKPRKELEALEQLVHVNDTDKIEKLRAALRATIKGETGDTRGQLALGWPHERINDNGTPSAFKLHGTGKRPVDVSDDLPTLEVLLEAITRKNPKDPLAGASSVKVQLFRDSDGEEPVSSAIPAIHWLFFEVELNDARYCFFDSVWYEIDNDYAQHVQERVDQIFARPPNIKLPVWIVAVHPNEMDYNAMAAESLKGKTLDRKLLTTAQHPRGFEACDIITRDGSLIHVKHIPKSSAVSHLIGQVQVATEALRYDNQARQKMCEVVTRAGGNSSWLPKPLKTVTLGIAQTKPISSTDLFSFSQVTLARLDSSLDEAGIKLTIAPIMRIQGSPGFGGVGWWGVGPSWACWSRGRLGFASCGDWDSERD